MSCFWFCAPSSSAWLRLRRSVTRRRNGQNPSKRFCGELPPACHFTPALEQEVRAHWALTFSIPVYSWYRLQFTILSHNNTDISSDQIRNFFFFSNSLLWPLSSYQAWPLSSLLCVRHVRFLSLTLHETRCVVSSSLSIWIVMLRPRPLSFFSFVS